MTAYIEWYEPYDSVLATQVHCRMTLKDVVRTQFTQTPRYRSAEQALDDFLAVHWGRIVREPLEKPE